MSLVVLKVGGSLLTCPDLPDRIRHLIISLAPDHVLIAVGGGAAADAVREWSRVHRLSDEAAHWLALRSLSATRALVRQLLPECVEVAANDVIPANATVPHPPLLLDLENYLRAAETTAGDPLPHTWDVTSDSIAAWVAARWKARRLILAKSIGLPPQTTVDGAARLGLVDRHFPQVAADVPQVDWCNLLDSVPCIEPWLRSTTAPAAPRTR